MALGQEKHLPHEAWHVVQQAQGRVRPTVQMKKTLMETEMTNRMQDIVTAATAADSGQIAWILVADAAGKIGSAVGVPSVTRFQIQLQANSATGDISYHGFPDEQALHTGLGSSRNNLT